MTGASQPALRVVDRQAPKDDVVRSVILPPAAGRWRAVVPPGLIPGDGTSTTLGSWDLTGLMDQLEAIYQPGWRQRMTTSAA